MSRTSTRLERYLDVSLYLLIVTGFATLASTGKLDAPAVAFVAAALLCRGYMLVRGDAWQVPERWTAFLTIAYALFYPADWLLLSENFVAATVHLVLFATVVKVFSARRDRDRVYLAVLSFAAVLGAAVWTVDTVFLVAFCVFLLLAVATFIAFEMKRSAEAASSRAVVARDSRRLTRSLAAVAAGLTLATSLCAVGLFFLLPRLSAGYMSEYAPRNDLVSGFSDDVRLGRIGEIQQSNTVVMHVQVEEDTQGNFDLKLRGVALSQFDGERWSKLPEPQEIIRNSLDGRFDLARRWRRKEGERISVSPRLLNYRVMMEPIASEVFFLAPTAQALMGAYGLISVDEGGAVSNEDRSRMIGIYRAISDISTPRAEALRSAESELPTDIAVRYLQLPNVDGRVRELAQQVTSSADNAYDKTAALERHLRTSYQYTLQLPHTRPSDPLAHFLFERKAGHCEYFASAMTIMLRTLGIPARIVNGFSGGEFNSVTGSYIVRARHAHSWVEAYFPGHGWVTFDPTPPSARPVSNSWQWMALYIDAMREFWREWVINYDFAHQTRLSTATVARGRHAFRDARRWWRRHYRGLVNRAHGIQEQARNAPGRFAIVILGSVMLASLLLKLRQLLLWWQERSLARRPERMPQAAAAIWYSRMARCVARCGFPKPPWQTPTEFMAAISNPKLRRSVEAFTEHYERARFGDSAGDALRLPELYAEVAASIRSKRTLAATGAPDKRMLE
ncbi:MAG TPA: DUF3488 and transglutaminase-like domain-containing protein [Terriglobales bacterium]|nr:DUF3488 and transglutaminase-like domain-containing protein [Terriglobales bacterium]